MVDTPTNIHDLPEFVLLEILCRLPLESTVQCMCVSKLWLRLISHPYFRHHFVRVQSHDNQKPFPRTLIFSDTRHKRRSFFSMSSDDPDHDLLFRTPRNFSMSFLPCFQDSYKENKLKQFDYKFKLICGEPIVVGAYNDLVLCCTTTFFQRHYYICNPYTRQWVSLPPSRFYQNVRVGFICDHYRKEDHLDHHRKEITVDQLNINDDQYRYKVVRILKPALSGTSFEFTVEIFSSETGKWTQSLVLSPQSFRFDRLAREPGIAYKGMLYWWSYDDGFIVGLDPYSKSINISSSTRTKTTENIYVNDQNRSCHFRFIDKPKNEFGRFDFLGVCRGRLRMCQFVLSHDHGHIQIFQGDINVWELKDDGPVNETGIWCLVVRIPLLQLIAENPLITRWRSESWNKMVMVVAFDPNDEDIMYLQLYEHVVMYNIREKTLKETPRTVSCETTAAPSSRAVFPVFQFALPWWPTPVHTRQKPNSSSSKLKSSGKRKSIFMEEADRKGRKQGRCF